MLSHPRDRAGWNSVQAARKPNFVLGDHSSRRRITTPLQQPTRRFRSTACAAQSSSPGRTGPVRVRGRRGALRIPAYLVLLRVGFTMPRLLPAARWALTPPFHPYPRGLRDEGGLFSVALAVYAPSRAHPGRYPAHCPAEFGLSSPAQHPKGSARQRSPGRLHSFQSSSAGSHGVLFR